MSWIKMETHTPDKPEIYAMAEILGLSPDDIFGKCFRVWAWFDAHTCDGKSNGVGVTKLLFDRVAGVTNFANSMISVGWLNDENGYLVPVNFDRHNGETAKQRALGAKRANKFRNDKSNAPIVTNALPREEKRRDITPIPPFVSQEVFNDFIQHRVQMKKPMSDVSQSRLISKLERHHKEGYDVNELLVDSIANGWQGVFLPNEKKPRQVAPQERRTV